VIHGLQRSQINVGQLSEVAPGSEVALATQSFPMPAIGAFDLFG
jgi:hypothetical protein